MAEAENFFWCTSDCGSGQIHESGHELPIVICLHCSHRSCFRHNVAWHQGLTCDEYDQLLANPDNFRSRLEIDNDAWAASQQAQLNADRAMAQGLLEEEKRVAEMRHRREREEREKTRKAIELARQIAARRKKEEEMSRITVGRTTKPCPGCGWAIEKNDGCSHMTCKWFFLSPFFFSYMRRFLLCRLPLIWCVPAIYTLFSNSILSSTWKLATKLLNQGIQQVSNAASNSAGAVTKSGPMSIASTARDRMLDSHGLTNEYPP
ncbi:hypothetical protein V8C44DRAFT_317345 [Trichoderma aethiopicum]